MSLTSQDRSRLINTIATHPALPDWLRQESIHSLTTTNTLTPTQQAWFSEHGHSHLLPPAVREVTPIPAPHIAKLPVTELFNYADFSAYPQLRYYLETLIAPQGVHHIIHLSTTGFEPLKSRSSHPDSPIKSIICKMPFDLARNSVEAFVLNKSFALAVNNSVLRTLVLTDTTVICHTYSKDIFTFPRQKGQ